MVYVTHDQIEAMTLADRIVVMNQGRIAQVGKPLELYYTPANLFVAGFIGSPAMNFFPAVVEAVEGGRARVKGDAIGPVKLPAAGLTPGAKLTLGVRPEHLGSGAAGRLHRDRDGRAGRAARRIVLRPCSARRRQADDRRNPGPRHPLARARPQPSRRRPRTFTCSTIRPPSLTGAPVRGSAARAADVSLAARLLQFNSKDGFWPNRTRKRCAAAFPSP